MTVSAITAEGIMDRQRFFDVGVRHVMTCGLAQVPDPAHATPEDGVPMGNHYLLPDGRACFLGANLLEVWPARRVRELRDNAPEGVGPILWSTLSADSPADRAFVEQCMNAHDEAGTLAEFRRACDRIAREHKLNRAMLQRKNREKLAP